MGIRQIDHLARHTVKTAAKSDRCALRGLETGARAVIVRCHAALRTARTAARFVRPREHARHASRRRRATARRDRETRPHRHAQAPTTAMVDCRCPVRLQTQVTGEDAGTDSVGDDFIKEAEI